MNKRLKIFLAILLLAAVCAAAYLFFFASGAPVTVASLNLDSATAQRGDIQVLVHGTGMLEVNTLQEVYSRVAGRVQTVWKEDGDPVEAGELILTLSSDTLEESLRTQTDDLYLRDLELSSSRTVRAATAIRAPMDGRVKLLHASKGDDMAVVQKQHGALAVLSTDGRMRIELPAPEDYASMHTPMEVKVHIGTQVEQGAVMSVDAQTLTVLIPNDTYEPGALASVQDLNGNSLGSGVLLINKPVMVTGVSGTIRLVEVKENDKVKGQDRLFALEDGALSLDVERQLLARDQLQRQVDDIRDKLSRLEIRAPISGVVAGVTLREGAPVQDGQQVAIVIQTDHAKVRLAVDELDIASVYPGQPAQIKVDAIPSKKYTTVVDRVLPVGTRAGDITSYDVLLYMDAQDNMLPYMSLSGDIVVAEADNTLMVPVAALQAVGEERYVLMMPTDADLAGANITRRRSGGPMMLMGGMGQSNDASLLEEIAPQLMRRVEVGLVSGEYAQIISGLQDGDRIVLPRSGTNLLTLMRMGGGFR